MTGSHALSFAGSLSLLSACTAFVAPSKIHQNMHARVIQADRITPMAGQTLTPMLKADVRSYDSRLPQASERFSSTALKDSNFNLDDLFGNKNTKNKITVNFGDVAGVDEAKYELQEIVEFLKNPEKFTKMGAKIPKGVLLEGPPGTGKTLLAKAVAGEAGVPFHAASGSEFVNMFVGKGAANVRDLFKQARRDSPAIVFIDEIDAVGKARGGFEGDSGERASTLNELLTQMDGFNSDDQVIVIGATNRADVLDSALVRPGRFDRQVAVGLPDRGGREAILRVHARNKPLEKDFSFEEVARRTPGFSGADLANLMNEAAILAARDDLPEISTEIANETIDRVIAGPKKIQHYMTEARKKLVAYHEAGHAVVGALLPEFDDVQRVSIIPRGQAAGLTWFVPNDEAADSGLYTYAYLKNNIAVTLGGRIAEEMIFGREGVTTGASNDLERVTQIARQIIKVFAMGDTLPMNLEPHKESGFVRSYADDVANKVDAQVEKVVKDAYDKAQEILEKNEEILDFVAGRLIKNEVMDGSELLEIVGGRRDFEKEDAEKAKKLTQKEEKRKMAHDDSDDSSPMAMKGVSPAIAKENQVAKMMESLWEAMSRL